MLRRVSNLVTILCFGVLICLPVALFSTKPWVDYTEQRSSTPWPDPPHGFTDLTRFTGQFQDYFNDHFGLRRRLIDLRARLDVQLLGQSPTNKVLIGKDDWLFYTGDQGMEDVRGRIPFDDKALDTWYQTIEARRRWLAAQGIDYLFVIVPNKETIYPEYLPRSVVRSGTTRLDQFAAYLAAKGEPAWLGDLRPTLLAHKDPLKLYIPSDTHWDPYGSYLAYQRIVERLDQDKPGVAVPLDLPPSQFAAGDVDIKGMLNAMGLHPRKVAIPAAIYVGPPLKCQAKDVPFEPTAVRATEKRLFQDTASDCAAPTAAGAGRALVFSDSMIFAMSDYLANSFGHIRFAVTVPGFDDLKRYVAIEHPDVVIEEQVERTLGEIPSQRDLPQLLAGPAPAADRAGWFDIIGNRADELMLEGWGEWQPQENGRRIGIDTNLPVTGSAIILFDRPDVVTATKDPRLAGSGFRLQLTLDPNKPRPDKPRLCLWTEDPALGRHRVNATAGKDWDTCVGDHDGAG